MAADARSCSAPPQGLKPLEQALDQLLTSAHPLAETEVLPTAVALGRVLAAAVISGVDVPPWDNSAMDGYAVNSAELGAGARLRVSQRIPAGSAAAPLVPGTAARIFTGAPLPAHADAVVMQERCRRDGEWIEIDGAAATGENVRRAGEDLHRGQEVLAPGTRLAPQHLGLAASVGAAEVQVFRRLRVAIFSSGDELVMPGQPLAPGQIYNSNQFTLGGLLQGLGCELVSLGIVEDNFEATCAALEHGAREADLVLASGGVSVGEEDHVKPAVEHLGRLDLWQIAMRPGKPLAFGHILGTPFIGSPGNPVSLFVTFCLLARPFVLRMQGVTSGLVPRPLPARAGFDWRRPDRRREFMRARLELDADGQAWVHVHPSRSSGVLSAVTWADGLVVIGENRLISKGDPVQFIPFSELLK